jgi:hypothetical protein
VEEVVVSAARDAFADRDTRAKSRSAFSRSDDPRIHRLGKRFMKKMDYRIESGNDGNAGETRPEVASISPVKFEHCAERLSETFMS